MAKPRKPASNKPWQGWLIEKLIRFLSWLPLWLVRGLAVTFAQLVYLLPSESKRVARINLGNVYTDLSTGDLDRLVKKNLIETSKTFAELCAMWCWNKSKLLPLIEQVSGEAHLQAALAKNRGVIFIAPHIGNWELIGPYLSAKYPSTFLYKPPNVPSAEAFMIESRGRFGAKLAPTDARGVRKLMKALGQNEVTVILPDQDPGMVGGVYAPFYNRPARTMTLLSKLLQKTECATVAVVMQRLKGINAGYQLHFLAVDEAIADEDNITAATALNKVVEQCIAIAPEQYLWSYKRYRKPPTGIEDIYKKPGK